MNKHSTLVISFLLLTIGVHFISCNNRNTTNENNYGVKTNELIQIVDSNPKIKLLLIEAINKAHEINPDTNTNPVQNLDDFYKFISWSETAMPWDLIRHTEHATLYNRIDQSLAYLFFITDIPLPKLQGKGYYNNSLQYEEPFCSWLTSFLLPWSVSPPTTFMRTPAECRFSAAKFYKENINKFEMLTHFCELFRNKLWLVVTPTKEADTMGIVMGCYLSKVVRLRLLLCNKMLLNRQ